MAVLLDIVWIVVDSMTWIIISTLSGLAFILEFSFVVIANFLKFSMYILSWTEILIVNMMSSMKMITSAALYFILFLVDFPNNINCILQFFEELMTIMTSWIVSLGDQFIQRLPLFNQLFLDFVDAVLMNVYNIATTVVLSLLVNPFDALVTFFNSAILACVNIGVQLVKSSTEICQNILWGSWSSVIFLITSGFNAVMNLFYAVLSYFFFGIQSAALSLVWVVKVFLWYICELLSSFFFSSYDSLDFSYPRYKYKTDPPKLDYIHPDPRLVQTSFFMRLTKVALFVTLTFLLIAIVIVLYHMRQKVILVGREVLDVTHQLWTRLNQNEMVEENQDDHVRRNRARYERIQNQVAEVNEDINGVNHRQRNTTPQSTPKQADHERVLRSQKPGTSSRSMEDELEQERDKQLCVVCQDNIKNILIFPCKHLCVCFECVEEITGALLRDQRRCPICRGKIQSYLEVYT